MSQEWHYSVDGGQAGPVSAPELKKLAAAGTLKPTDLVWKEGMANWVEAKSIKGLFGGAATPAAGSPRSEGKPAEPEEVEDRSPQSDADDDYEEEEDRPRSRKRDDEEDDYDDRPARRRRDEDDQEVEDRPRKKKRGRRVPEDTSNKKMVAGLLGILLGGWGIHKFYLGMTTPGILQIVITFATCGAGGIIGLIEGIIYLTKSDEDFYQTYIVEQKGWF